MDGVIIINKPKNMTSHDVVGQLRKILKTKKVGHAGTLDPLATGVLVLGVGKATNVSVVESSILVCMFDYILTSVLIL